MYNDKHSYGKEIRTEFDPSATSRSPEKDIDVVSKRTVTWQTVTTDESRTSVLRVHAILFSLFPVFASCIFAGAIFALISQPVTHHRKQSRPPGAVEISIRENHWRNQSRIPVSRDPRFVFAASSRYSVHNFDPSVTLCDYYRFEDRTSKSKRSKGSRKFVRVRFFPPGMMRNLEIKFVRTLVHTGRQQSFKDRERKDQSCLSVVRFDSIVHRNTGIRILSWRLISSKNSFADNATCAVRTYTSLYSVIVVDTIFSSTINARDDNL